MGNDKKNNLKENILKSIVVIIIALGIANVWIAKNKEKNNINTSTQEEPVTVEENKEINNEIQTENKVSEKENKNIEQPTPEVNLPKQSQSVEQPAQEEQPIQQPQEPEKQEIDKNDPNFDLVVKSLDLETLKSYKLPMLIDFGSDSCAPCREMAPVLVELNTELRGKVIVKFVDVWEYPSASEGFDFSLIPTQFFFDKDGNRYTSHTGGLTKDEAMRILKELGVE